MAARRGSSDSTPTVTAARSPPGHAANLCVIDPAHTWSVDGTRLASKSRNSPWDGWKLTGKVRHTIYRGKPTVRDQEPTR